MVRSVAHKRTIRQIGLSTGCHLHTVQPLLHIAIREIDRFRRSMRARFDQHTRPRTGWRRAAERAIDHFNNRRRPFNMQCRTGPCIKP